MAPGTRGVRWHDRLVLPFEGVVWVTLARHEPREATRVAESTIGETGLATVGVPRTTGVGRDDLDEVARRVTTVALDSYGDSLVRLRDRTAPRWMHRVSAILIAIGAIALVMAFAFRLEALGIGTLSGTEFIATLVAGTVLLCVGAFVGLYSIVLEA